MFHDTVFGPIHSRRLGTSLGLNLLPNDGKVCTFDCLYCEAGFNAQGTGATGLPKREDVATQLEARLKQMLADGEPLDVITFSGNGEPTMHPEFAGIVEDTARLRDKYYPEARLSVLTNSTRIFTPEIAEALKRVDNNILKLDSAVEGTMRVIDRPTSENFTVERVVKSLRQFSGTGIVQTMMVRGQWNGKEFDNTTDEEIEALIETYRRISPREIMIYSLDRPTPAKTLQKIPAERLQAIGKRIAEATGIPVKVN